MVSKIESYPSQHLFHKHSFSKTYNTYNDLSDKAPQTQDLIDNQSKLYCRTQVPSLKAIISVHIEQYLNVSSISTFDFIVNKVACTISL